MVEIKYWINRKIFQIKKVIKFLPILWQIYDFDYCYSVNLFKKQLEETADFLDSESSSTLSASYNAGRIRTVLKLMDRVYDDYYGMEFQGKLREKYGDNCLDMNNLSDDNKVSRLRYEYENWENKEEIEFYYNKWFIESQNKQKKAHRLLWKLIEENIQKWWD